MLKQTLLLAVALALPALHHAQTFSTIHEETGSIQDFIEIATMPGKLGKTGFQVWYLGDGTRYSVVTDEEKKPFQFAGMPHLFAWLKKQGYQYRCDIQKAENLRQQGAGQVMLFEKKE